MPQVISSVDQLKKMPLPSEVLMCPPDYFDVIDVKNPFMEGQVGNVDRSLARRQWDDLKEAFTSVGVKVNLIKPVKDREDMVFCANQTFVGLDADRKRLCVLSHMKHPSRRAEVPAFADWFNANGYKVVSLPQNDSVLFEGSGDTLWHPGRALIWGGYGHRTNPEVYSSISDFFGAPVITLELKTERFYHLDTCFCPIDEKTVLVYPPSLTDKGMALIRKIFSDVIVVNQYEAMERMACNAAAFLSKHVVIQRGSEQVNQELRRRGFKVTEVETSEYMKSGGSVFCMKMTLF
ncbi:MAG: arginine deiminase-related protein [Bdellovibrionota bacterium]